MDSVIKIIGNISLFMSFPSVIISLINSCCNFDLYFLCLFGVGSVTGFGVGSAAGSCIRSHVGILSKFFIGNNLLLKLLRTFSLALNNNPKLFKITFVQVFLSLFHNTLIQQQNYFT